MPPSLYLALSYLKPKRHMLSAINVLAVLGTLLGVAVLIIVISIMNGFDTMWREKILSFHPHVSVFSPEIILDEEDPLFDEVRAHPDVISASPFIHTKVMAQNREQMVLPFLRGIDAENDFLFRRLQNDPDARVDGELILGDEACLIGMELARNLGVRAGDVISVISPTMFAREGEIRLPVDLRVAGVFTVGMYQIDNEFLLTDLQTARDVLGADEGVDGIQVIGTSLMGANRLARELEALAGPRFEAYSWMELEQTLFNTLAVEKNMMFFLLTVISVVASFLICCTLIMMSVQKTKEIGLLKSMGYRNGTVMGAFMWYGMIQGTLGILLGTGTGLLVLKHRQAIMMRLSRIFGVDMLPPELYFLYELPSETRGEDLVMILLLVLVLCLTGGSIPAWWAARRNPVEALRHEG